MTEFAGTLRERIVIEQPVTTRTEAGLLESGWQPFARCWAEIALDGVGPEAEGQSLSAMPRLRITIRRHAGVTIDQRICWGERRMLVRQVLDDPRTKDRLVCRCEEVRA